MSFGTVNPARLDGDDLARWYRRPLWQIDQERRAAAAQRYGDFFNAPPSGDAPLGPDGSQPDPESDDADDHDDGSADFSQNPDSQPESRTPASTDGAPPAPVSWLYPIQNQWRTSLLPVDPGVSANASGAPSPPRPISAGQTSSLLPSTGLLSGAVPTDGTASLIKVSSPTRNPQLDPSRTNVFQPGPDGKLHPIPGWRTTGPFDFETWSHNIDWNGVGKDLGDIASNASMFVGLGEAAPFLEAVSPNLDAITADAIIKAFEKHHPDPMFMGGRPQQDLVRLEKSVHGELNQTLARLIHTDDGLTPILA
jgi:hypothetical protein